MLGVLVASVALTLFAGGAGAASATLPQQKGLLSLPADANLEISGANAYDNAGGSIASAGDVNGDGLTDILVGAPGASNNGRRRSGSVYVVFGRRQPGNVNLGTLAESGYRIDGGEAYDNLGRSVASAGDVNGDGRSDLLIGSSGAVYVVFGKGTTGNVDLASLGSGGFEIFLSGRYGAVGGPAAAAGDVNSDGRADLLIGAPNADANGRSSAGSAYVVFGKASSGDVDLASLGDGGFRIDGANAYDYAGSAVAGAGDLNGDGRPDLLVGAPNADANGRSNSGSAYVVFGKATTTSVDLTSLGSGGYRIDGANAYDYAGSSVSNAGDLNGDGRRDVLVTAPDASNNGRVSSGSVYAVFSRTMSGNIDLASLGDGGFRVDGANAYDYAGTSIAPGGDVNGDDKPDLLVGMTGWLHKGAYAVFGSATPSNVDLGGLGDRGFFAATFDSGESASTVAAVGDVNGDGRPDVVVGTPETRYQDQASAGAAHVLYGFGTPELSYASIVAVAGRPAGSAAPTLMKRTGPARLTASPPLPTGLKLDPGSGVVSGTAALPERRTTYTVTMTDLAGTVRAPLTVTIRDETPPALVLRARTPQRVVRQAGLIVRAACNEACTLLASGTVRVGASRVIVGLRTTHMTLHAQGTATLRLTLSPRAESRLARLLRKVGYGHASVTVRAVDRAGNATSATRIVALTG